MNMRAILAARTVFRVDPWWNVPFPDDRISHQVLRSGIGLFAGGRRGGTDPVIVENFVIRNRYDEDICN